MLLYTRLTIVPGILALFVGGIGVAAVAPFATPAEAAAAAIAFPAAALAGLAGAIVVLVREERTDMADGQLLPPEVAGMREVYRTVIPLVIALVGCLPAITARIAHRLGDPLVARTVQGAEWPLLVTSLVFGWMHRRDEIAAWQKDQMSQAKPR